MKPNPAFVLARASLAGWACDDDQTVTDSDDADSGDRETVGLGTLPRLRIDDEPAGMNCAYGGSAVHGGLDLDMDGALDDDEVTSTAYVCDDMPPPRTVLEGSFTVENSIDAALLFGVTEITGSLAIRAGDLTELDLSRLEFVDPTATLRLPALTSANAFKCV